MTSSKNEKRMTPTSTIQPIVALIILVFSVGSAIAACFDSSPRAFGIALGLFYAPMPLTILLLKPSYVYFFPHHYKLAIPFTFLILVVMGIVITWGTPLFLIILISWTPQFVIYFAVRFINYILDSLQQGLDRHQVKALQERNKRMHNEVEVENSEITSV